MKIVVLQGSPRIKGSTSLLAREFTRGARDAGHAVELLDVAHMNIAPCLSCQKCGMDGPCVQRDDNQQVETALLNADMVVFVTPIHFYGMSAQLKIVVDRLYNYCKRLAARKLKSALIAASWDTNEKTLSYLHVHYLAVCGYLNFQNMGVILAKGCGNPETTKESDYFYETYDFGRALGEKAPGEEDDQE